MCFTILALLDNVQAQTLAHYRSSELIAPGSSNESRGFGSQIAVATDGPIDFVAVGAPGAAVPPWRRANVKLFLTRRFI